MDNDQPPEAAAETVRCAECGTSLSEGQDREITEGGVFCRPCFNNLTAQLQQFVEDQSRDVNYPMGIVGGVLGGVAGSLVWWGFTVVTQIAFGLVAVVIGFAVGKGVTLLTGGKRSVGLQAISVVIATVSFFYASFLVNRTFIHRAFAEQGESLVIPLLPSPMMFVDVVRAGFGVMDLVFLAIVAWQAWVMPKPVRIGG